MHGAGLRERRHQAVTQFAREFPGGGIGGPATEPGGAGRIEMIELPDASPDVLAS